MSILIKAVSGLVAGVVAGGLGLAFVPRVAPNALKPRHAVEKPQFVDAVASRDAARVVPAVLAVAATPAVARPPAAPAPSTKPALAGNPAATVVIAKLDPPKLAPPKLEPLKPAASETSVAVVSPAPSPSSPPTAANEAAARWSVQGLVALAKGDLASARQFLSRAAEAGDPRAWVALADTYDPAILSKLGVVGAPGDAQRARDYLIKAANAGVVVAKDRMAAADQGSGSVR
ncbi:MAG TPA: hypothetical protein VN715_22815 [Roseiarcus sp.]|nr:hypothetical protein [Roseiarcus sp.]